MIACLNPCD
jgi:hypothetical protein